MLNLQVQDRYVSTLDSELLSRAKELWGEDEDLRNQMLQTIREWISLQPHFTCRTDAYFLVSFARGCDYSLEEMKRRLNTQLSMKTSVPEFFSGWDPLKPEVQAALQVGMQLPIPGYDIHGRKVVVIRNGCFDPLKHKPEDLEKANFMVMECLGKSEERVSIGGLVIIFDMNGATMAHMMHKPISMIRKHVNYIQGALPFNPKALIFIRTPSSFSVGINLMFAVFNEKLKKMVQVLGNDFDALHKAVGRDFLPSDYGGCGMSLAELSDYWKKRVEEDRDYIMAQEKFRADESKRPVQPKTSIFNLFWSSREK